MELRIREILESKDIKVSSLAETVGITRANMSNIVNGKSTPSLETLEKIANALEVEIWELLISKGEIVGKSNAASLTCPHCGKSITLKAE